MNTFTIRRPDDLHIHFRNGLMLKNVVPLTAKHWGRVLAMPNLTPPIISGSQAVEYKNEIERAAGLELCGQGFEALTTIKILPSTTPETIREAKKMNIIAGKIYPEGVTTNSMDGVSDFKALWPVFEAMQEVGMVLCLHGETPDSFVMDREKDFLPIFARIAKGFPKLRIVLEHITTRAAMNMVIWARNRKLPVAATITIHHLLISLHDVLCYRTDKGEFLNPHLYCKPVAKRPEDREELLWAAFSGRPEFFYGGDSAPHPREKKESDRGCAGVFNAPVALPLLVELFDKHNRLDKLENFVSRFGAEFYDLPLNKGSITLEKKPWVVPEEYNGVVPFLAGKEISWLVC